jgi:uncharacterized protein YecE (DUF72 family)
MLGFYAQRFGTVEINNSFYRLPSPEAVQSWVSQTPAEFRFAVKASRYITHNRKLRDPEQSFAKFFAVVKGFGEKLGPILFQLPPAWLINRERLEEFLTSLPPGNQYAFEFRNPSWHTPEIYNLLARFNAAFCIFEIAGFRSSVELTAPFTYVRLHGPGNAYQGKYSDSALCQWAKMIERWISEKRSVYFYFDNDQAGFAAENALQLSCMVRGTTKTALEK